MNLKLPKYSLGSMTLFLSSLGCGDPQTWLSACHQNPLSLPAQSDLSTASPKSNALRVWGKDSLDEKGNPQNMSNGVNPPEIRALVLFYPLSLSFLVCEYIPGVLRTVKKQNERMHSQVGKVSTHRSRKRSRLPAMRN